MEHHRHDEATGTRRSIYRGKDIYIMSNSKTTRLLRDLSSARTELPRRPNVKTMSNITAPAYPYAIDRVQVDDGVNIFYRSAGLETAPVLLLLHGFPASSLMFRNLIPLLAISYRVIVPDLPGFGFTEVPEGRNYNYTFANLATTIEAFLDALNINRFAVYIFDYGAPVGLRLALSRPSAVSAIISQNGNAYEEGLGKTSGHLSKSTGKVAVQRTGKPCGRFWF